ncbi:hypothetical protein F4818DRAFT_452951 [Hypoxylon cercidicola]|nr:hypothetical protein F4818DRAFT_452951 [Hypoxylon cercidicola]
MICAGAGVAPFAGFVAHRAAQQARGRDPLAADPEPAPAILFVGCRSPRHAPRGAELSRLADVRYAYSRDGGEEREGGGGGGGGGKGFVGYVQDRVWADREELARLWGDGARVYVCGSRAVSRGVKEVVRRIYREAAERRCGAKTEAEVDEWWVDILRDRYAVDVF